MAKDHQEFPDQRRERDVHDKKGDGEFLSDEPGPDYLFTHVMEQIRKQSAVAGAAKIIENPLKQAERTSFFVNGLLFPPVMLNKSRTTDSARSLRLSLPEILNAFARLIIFTSRWCSICFKWQLS